MDINSPPPESTSFATFLAAIEDGVFHADLTSALADLTRELRAHHRDVGGKATGKISIDLTITLDKDFAEVKADHKVVTPKAARGRTIFWTTADGKLTKRNPAQHDMFRDVTAVTAAPRAV